MTSKIYIVGTGNLATSLGNRIAEVLGKGMPVFGGWVTRNKEGKSHKPVTDLSAFSPQPDDYVFVCTPDARIHPFIAAWRHTGACFIHCSGGIPLKSGDYSADAVFYPFQTFHPTFPVDWSAIPVFWETESEKHRKFLADFGKAIGGSVYELDSEKRRLVHLSGVFASNFTNAMYLAAESTVAKAGIPMSALIPLIIQTARKASALKPENAQTGPAVRGDEEVMNAHLELLRAEPELHDIYQKVSAYIMHRFKK